MYLAMKNALVLKDGTFSQQDVGVSICSGRAAVVPAVSQANCAGIPVDRGILIPGLVDVHVHLREPGFSYKETIASGTAAAAHGGYTAVCTMPNLRPAPDSVEHLAPQLEAIRQDAAVPVYPYGTITIEQAGQELAELEALAPHVIAFSDDGHGVQNDGVMLEAMQRAKKLGKLIVAHCEDNRLLHGGYIHDGAYARQHGHKGICSESEWGQIKRDLELVRRTGCGYHVCHVSAKESVELLRQAKREGLDVSCETAPHYLVLNDSMLQEDGRFKMNPPIRAEEDRQALLEGVQDGTIDLIATDHAPHSREEKAKGLAGSLMGVVGLETAFAVLYTELVLTGQLSLERLVECMAIAPRKRFQIPLGDEFTVFSLDEPYTIDSETFCTKGRSTPFEGRRVYGRCLVTAVNGAAVWLDEEYLK